MTEAEEILTLQKLSRKCPQFFAFILGDFPVWSLLSTLGPFCPTNLTLTRSSRTSPNILLDC